MRARTARRGTLIVALCALAVAACQPVTQSAPPAAPDGSLVEQIQAQAQAAGYCGGGDAPPESLADPAEYGAVVRRPGEAFGTIETFTVTSEAELEAVVEQLATEGEVLALETGNVVTALVPPNPSNDPLYVQQYGPAKAGLDVAWAADHDGSGQVVAVVDSGVQATHEDLAGRVDIIDGFDFVAGIGNGTNDENGHGTHVAGIVAASDNTNGIIGGAPAAMILPVRVLDDDGNGPTDRVALGIDWAVAHGADVINLSLGIAGCRSYLMETAVANATAADVVVVASAGNCGTGCAGVINSPVSPASGPKENVIAVGGTDQFDQRGSYSNYNRRAIEEWPPWLNLYVDVAAPGSSIISTCAGGGYCVKGGTSMSAPFVSAAAALLRQACGPLTTAQVEQALRSTAIPVESLGPGVGLLQAGAAILATCP